MELFKLVTEQRLRSYLEDIGFINKYQSGFRLALSLLMIISLGFPSPLWKVFNRREHVVAAFLDIEKRQ